METRNVLLAVILSTIVLVFWATFFEPPPIDQGIKEELNEFVERRIKEGGAPTDF